MTEAIKTPAAPAENKIDIAGALSKLADTLMATQEELKKARSATVKEAPKAPQNWENVYASFQQVNANIKSPDAYETYDAIVTSDTKLEAKGAGLVFEILSNENDVLKVQYKHYVTSSDALENTRRSTRSRSLVATSLFGTFGGRTMHDIADKVVANFNQKCSDLFGHYLFLKAK